MPLSEADLEYARGRDAVDRVVRQADDVTTDDFQYWLFFMDDDLRWFFDSLPSPVRDKLDFSVESLDAIEAWIVGTFTSSQHMLDERAILDGIARYVGETIRRSVGGRWELRLDDPKYIYFRIPQLTDFGPRSMPECPQSLATAAASRRTGTYLRGVVDNMRRRYAPN